MLNTFGQNHYLVILRVYQNTKHHMNSKQRRNANTRNNNKKTQNVRNSNASHINLVNLFNSPIKLMANPIPGPNRPIHPSQQSGPDPSGPMPHYGNPRVTSVGPNRYTQGGNPGGGYSHPNQAAQEGSSGYGNTPYSQQRRGEQYGSSGIAGPGARGGGRGAPNHPQGGQFGGPGAGRGNRNQQYGKQR